MIPDTAVRRYASDPSVPAVLVPGGLFDSLPQRVDKCSVVCYAVIVIEAWQSSEPAGSLAVTWAKPGAGQIGDCDARLAARTGLRVWGDVKRAGNARARSMQLAAPSLVHGNKRGVPEAVGQACEAAGFRERDRASLRLGIGKEVGQSKRRAKDRL